MKYLTYALSIFFAAIAISFADDKATVMANEKTAWQTYKDRSAEGFKKVVDKDVRVVSAAGMANMQNELDDMKKWDIKSFSISDFDSFSDAPDVIVATYKIKLEAAFEGKDMSGMYNAGTVWKKEGSDWLAIFHTHAKEEKPAK